VIRELLGHHHEVSTIDLVQPAEPFCSTVTRDLVSRYLPEVKRVRDGLQGNWSGYDTRKAEKAVGFKARHLFPA
jgi:hypothetical protein